MSVVVPYSGNRSLNCLGYPEFEFYNFASSRWASAI
jgi:hypothetical protein